MATHYNEKGVEPVSDYGHQEIYDGKEKRDIYDVDVGVPNDHHIVDEVIQSNEIEATGHELEDLEGKMALLTPERTRKIIAELYKTHEHDQNFPRPILDRMKEYLADPAADHVDNEKEPNKLLAEMKLEAILATENSPYLEVRANVDPTDDVNMPSLTFRVLIIGTIFSGIGSFIDGLFLNRQPSVSISANVAQLVAYPIGKFMHRVLPARKFNTFGHEWSLNPGRFSKKEHMLITIMCNVSFVASYTGYIIPTQALPFFFDMSFARDFGYQILAALGTNFVGYGLAGLCRRFLVYPAVAIWPSSFAQIALNRAFHAETNEPVPAFGRIWRASQQKTFLIIFVCSFLYFFFPSFIFQALSYFSWMTWIAPNNAPLTYVTGTVKGLGVNPWPTFDWNMLNPNGNMTLTVPTFSFVNQFIGMIFYTVMTLIIYYKNAWFTAYLPINTNHTYDNRGKPYNVTRILNDEGNFDNEKYQQYSEPYMGAAYIVAFIFYFVMYGATVAYVAIYHRHDLKVGWKSAVKSFKKTFNKSTDEEDEDDLSEDVHYRLMKQYPEVPEWQYLIIMLVAMALGMVGLGVYPTHVSPAVVLFGVIMPIIVMIPCGLIQAITGIPIPLNVIAEFIGGAIVPGNANSLIYFKTYGYIAAYQALLFCNDLKLAHYLHLPPRHTFYMQIWATLVFCFVQSAIQNFIMGFRDVCTEDAVFGMSCPGSNTFFTSAVFWGTLGPTKLFGPGKRYNMMLLGFPAGFLLVGFFWGLRKLFPKNEMLRQAHPVMIAAGPAYWGAPYNMSYLIPNLYITVFSFGYIRKHYTAFWAKYNYIVAAAMPAGIAVSALVIFFALAIPKNGTIAIDWWGNNVISQGCEATGCVRLKVAPGEFFGNPKGSFT
ncbi:hypothetical protein Q8F55_007658 [Vanrija albida]|uniref:OPT family small oligopeptide transporter n=1 Tax=Vanrija albida TaxID=181172 RepID=A0ABR3PUG4_9TREE